MCTLHSSFYSFISMCTFRISVCMRWFARLTTIFGCYEPLAYLLLTYCLLTVRIACSTPALQHWPSFDDCSGWFMTAKKRLSLTFSSFVLFSNTISLCAGYVEAKSVWNLTHPSIHPKVLQVAVFGQNLHFTRLLSPNHYWPIIWRSFGKPSSSP